MSKIIKIEDLMEDKKFCDEKYFLFEFCCKVMEDIAEKLIESEGRKNIQNHDIELEIKVNGREVDSADFCKSFIDCIETNLKSEAREVVGGLFNEKINSIRNELDVLESKTQEMNAVLDWDDIWNKKFLKKD